MKKRMTVTIGIPAYQSRHNIKALLLSLLSQKQKNIIIEKIIVYADGCTDGTEKQAKVIQSPLIEVYSGKKNRGYAYAMQYIIGKTDTDIFVALNDDISINSTSFIEALVAPFRRNIKIGFVSGNIVPLPPATFVGKCVYASFLAFVPIRLKWRDGISKFTCDGKALALRKDFYKTLNLHSAPTATVDIYLYFENLRQKRKYAFAKDAEIRYRLPESIEDFRNQEIRTKKGYEVMKHHFGEIVEKEHKVPLSFYYLSAFNAFLKYPVESLFFKLIINSIYFMPIDKNFTQWKLASTTKRLSTLVKSLFFLEVLLS